MQYINLCPHAIEIIGPSGGVVRVIEPSGEVARCVEQTEYPIMFGHEDIPLIFRTYGQVTGLPEEDKSGRLLYVVSSMVRLALPQRIDLASPGDVVRDGEGHIIGTKNLIINDVA